MGEKSKILVVDDDEVVQLSHMRVLAEDRYSVEAVWNGADALDAMTTRKYDLVLLDLRMPGMDGMAVLRQIKQRWPDVEVVIITGYPSLESAKEALSLGAYDYLAKPLGPDDIAKTASNALLHGKWALRH